MLTRKQHKLLMFIHERIKESGVSPSFDEMKEALDLASKSGIHRLITALEERGFLRRLPHRARALEVVKLPQQATAAAPPKGRAPFKPQLVDGGRAIGGRDDFVVFEAPAELALNPGIVFDDQELARVFSHLTDAATSVAETET